LFGDRLFEARKIPLDSCELSLRIVASVPNLYLISAWWVMEGRGFEGSKLIIFGIWYIGSKGCIGKVIVIEYDFTFVIIDE